MKPVKMFTTQVCPYCQRAKRLLEQRGVLAIEELRVDLQPALVSQAAPVRRPNSFSATGRRAAPVTS